MATKSSLLLPSRGFLAEAPTDEDVGKFNTLLRYESFLDLTQSATVARLIAARAECLVLQQAKVIFTNKDAQGHFNGDSLQRATHDWVSYILAPRHMRERVKDVKP